MCAKRGIGVEEVSRVCLDRDAWRSVTDTIMIDKVWARAHFRRGTKGDRDLRWDSAGSFFFLQWSLVGGPGCDQTP